MEAYGIRSRGWIRHVIRLVAICAVIIGAYNFLLAPFLSTGAILTAYRDLLAPLFTSSSPLLADLAMMIGGAVVGWFV
jgi:hypothetical protein